MKLNLFILLPIILNIIGILIYFYYIYKLSDDLNPLSNELKNEFSFSLFIFLYLPLPLLIIICILTDQLKTRLKIIIPYFIWILFIVTPLIIFKEGISQKIWKKWDIFHTAQQTTWGDWVDKRKYVKGHLVDSDETLTPEQLEIRTRAAKSERNERIDIDDNIYS